MSENKTNEHKNKVAIIGAGMAGCAAARVWLDAGFEVDIYEKSRGTGGRLSRKSFAGHNYPMGAYRFYAISSEFRQQVTAWQTQTLLEPCGESQWFNSEGLSTLTRHLSQGANLITQHRVESMQALSGYQAVLSAAPLKQAEDLVQGLTPFWPANCFDQTVQPTWTALIDGANVEHIRRVFQGQLASIESLGEQHHVAHFSFQTSQAWEEQGLSDQTQRAQDLAKQLGLPAEQVYCHRWLYAHHPQALGIGAMWSDDGQYGLAGGWCWQDTVEGAWMSGTLAAQGWIESNA